MRKASKLVAVLAVLTVVMAAFMGPAVAKKGHGKGKGKGKKATIVSWDETTRTLVLTNKKAHEQTLTVAADADLTKVVPCDDDDDTTEDSTEDTTEGTEGDGTDVTDGTEGDGSGDGSTEGEDDSSEGEDVKTCGNMAATTADLVPGYRVLNWKERDGVVSRLKVKVPSADDSEEATEDDPSDDSGDDLNDDSGDGSVDDGGDTGTTP